MKRQIASPVPHLVVLPAAAPAGVAVGDHRRTRTRRPPAIASPADLGPAAVQGDMWGPTTAPAEPAVNLDLAYAEAVARVREALEARAGLRDLVVNAVRLAVRAGVSQDRVRQDLGLSRSRASELHRAIALEDDLVLRGILPWPGVTISHLEALLPVAQDEVHDWITEIQGRGLSVAELRREIRDSKRAEEDLSPRSALVMRHLGRFLKSGWEAHVDELLAAVAAVADGVPMGTPSGI